MKNKLSNLIHNYFTSALTLNYIENYVFIYVLYLFVNYFIAHNLAYGNTMSFYDIYYWNLSECQHLIFFHSTFYIVLVHKLITSNNNIYFMLKYKSRRKLYIVKICTILLTSLIYIFISLLISFVQYICSYGHIVTWSNFTQSYFPILYANSSSSRLSDYLFPFTVNLIFYMITIGLIYFTLYIVTNKNLTILIYMLINIVTYVVYLCKKEALYPFMLIGNVSLGIGESKINNSINIEFWFILILLLGIISYIFYNRLNLVGERE